MFYHLPWYVMHHWACWQCRAADAKLALLWVNHGQCQEGAFSDRCLPDWLSLMAGSLHDIALEYGMTLHGLMVLVIRMAWHPAAGRRYTITLVVTSLLQMLQQYIGLPPPSGDFILMPPQCYHSLGSLGHPDMSPNSTLASPHGGPGVSGVTNEWCGW